MSTRVKKYHHGALRGALLASGLAMIEEGGSEAVSLRHAARRTGVSSAAVFRHFDNKDTFLAALAAHGFEQLAGDLRGALRSIGSQLQYMGVAYVGFALRHPGWFRLMFGPVLAAREQHPELKEAAGTAFALLANATRAGGGEDADAAVMRWARVHGLAHLALDGLLDDPGPERIRRLLKAT